jgi:four helix bundle protein
MLIPGVVPPAKHFTELVVWQLGDEIRREVLTLTSRGGFCRDLKLRAQTEDAANSVCRSIAEGFGCDSHREFARFLVIARRSLNELQDAFKGAEQAGYIQAADLVAIRSLLRRLYPAFSRLLAYLRATPDHRTPGTAHPKPRPHRQW